MVRPDDDFPCRRGGNFCIGRSGRAARDYGGDSRWLVTCGTAVAGGPLIRPRPYLFPSCRRPHVRVVAALDITINFVDRISDSIYVLVF